MARTHASVLALMAIATAVAGCGLAGVPRMGLGAGGPHPAIEAPDTDTPVAPAFKAPVISDEAMERAVQAGLARSDEQTWRKVESCLTPTGSQLEQMLEQLQSQRGRGARPDVSQFTFRSASLDPRLGCARVLKQRPAGCFLRAPRRRPLRVHRRQQQEHRAHGADRQPGGSRRPRDRRVVRGRLDTRR